MKERGKGIKNGTTEEGNYSMGLVPIMLLQNFCNMDSKVAEEELSYV